MSQTAYAINIPAVSYPGQLADGSNFKDVLSGLAVAAGMVYGTLAVGDATNTGGFDKLAVKAPAAATDITDKGSALGVVIADQARAQNPAVANPTYPQFAAVPCLRKGRIWVKSETAVDDGAPVFVRFAATVNGSVLGAFRADADTISTVDAAAALPGAVFRGTYAAPGFVVVELDLV
jgi:hypothetical protein